MSLIVSLSPGEEVRRCLLCGANLRYELLADVLRARDLESQDVLELDAASPLRPLLMRARTYHRSYHDPKAAPGSVRADGARMEDLTRLTFPDESLDLIVSSDVLEHIADLEAAFAETARVLRPGGMHLFTVPFRERTRRRPPDEPEFHGDPEAGGGEGILTEWDIGADAAGMFGRPDLELSMSVPQGQDRRVVWSAARRLPTGQSPAR